MRNNRDLDSIMGDLNESEEHERKGSDDSVEAIGDSQEQDNNGDSIMSISEYERISFDKFEAVDLRVAKILDAEVHQSARKPMYKLTLDLGELGKRTIVAGIGDKKAEAETFAERAFGRVFGIGCDVPIGALAFADEKKMSIEIAGFLSDIEGKKQIRKSIEGSLGNPEGLGRELGKQIMENGGEDIIAGNIKG